MAGVHSLRKVASSLVAGASDTDPSAVVTCTQVGATTGLSLLAVFPFTTIALVWLDRLAIRVAVQRDADLPSLFQQRLGLALGRTVLVLFLGVNLVVLGADISAAAAVIAQLTHMPQALGAAAAAGIPAILLLGGSFAVVRRSLLLLTPLYALFIVAAIVANPRFEGLSEALQIERQWSAESVLSLVALAGAILTPYVFFWQADDTLQEARRRRRTPPPGIISAVGMAWANVVFLAIVWTAGSTLHVEGAAGLQLSSVRQASDALEPLLGPAAFFAFSVAIVTSALIAIPVIAAVSANAAAVMIRRRHGLNWPIAAARPYYGFICFTLAAGLAFALLDINPVGPLFWAQFANGVILPLLVVLLLSNAGRR